MSAVPIHPGRMEQIISRLGPWKLRFASAAGLLVLVVLLACISGWASPEGSISGKVVDPSEAVIPEFPLSSTTWKRDCGK